jgi:hypothetical protein
VKDPSSVRRDQRVGDLFDPSQADGELGRALFAQHVGDGAPVDELHHEEVAAVVLDHVVERDDVRVTDRRRGAGLAQHARAALGIGRELGGQHLERDVTLESLVLRAPHFAHRALAEQRDQPIRPDQVADVRHQYVSWSTT